MHFTLAALALAIAAAQTSVEVQVGSTQSDLQHLWRSGGFTPAEFGLRDDTFENFAWIGSVPQQGIRQIRIHYLLDLLIVTGFRTDPSGDWILEYDWGLLWEVLDRLAMNSLVPGFEIMGSPIGFPPLPISFAEPYSGNGQIPPAQTLAMYRVLVRDVAVAISNRYGTDIASEINWESWNEPSCGWGWQLLPTNMTLPCYQQYWDATAGGIEDAEKLLGTSLRFGGPAECRGPPNSEILAWVIQHASNGTNQFTGSPGRLDFISIHYKGGGSSGGTVEGEFQFYEWLRGPDGGAASTWTIPFTNDEADPEVGWDKLLDWRADARYAAMVVRAIVQHYLLVVDNPAAANPMLLISNDNAFLPSFGLATFSQRTLLTRFNANASTPTGEQPFALVGKPGWAVMQLLSRLGDQRAAITGVSTSSNVLYAPIGGLASSFSGNGGGVSVVVYNSNDTVIGNASNVATINLSVGSGYFAPGSAVTVAHFRLDNANGNPSAVWDAAGQPFTPSSALLQQMWAATGVPLLLPPFEVTVASDGSVAVPSFALPMPGISLLHLAQEASSPAPLTPINVAAWLKNPALSLLDSSSQREVLLRWNCSLAAPTTMLYRVQLSSSSTGPWSAATLATPETFSCMAMHIATPSADSGNLYYQVAAVDYWGRMSGWSAAAQVQQWAGESGN
jgi:L-iduronidase